MSETKPTNPKDAVGIKKYPMHVLPQQVLAEIGLALMEGARKYGAYNWRVAGVRNSVYFDAAMRHMQSWWEGQDIDPDSGVHHLVKALACLLVIRDAQLQGMFTDDRPPSSIRKDTWVSELNAQAAQLIERYPECKAPNTIESVEPHDVTGTVVCYFDDPALHQQLLDGQAELRHFGNVVLDGDAIKEYDGSGLVVRETTHQSKEDAIRECEQRYGVVFSDT